VVEQRKVQQRGPAARLGQQEPTTGRLVSLPCKHHTNVNNEIDRKRKEKKRKEKRTLGGDDGGADDDEGRGDLVQLPLEVGVALIGREERLLGVLQVEDARHVLLGSHQLEQRLTARVGKKKQSNRRTK
jgi:hypothetical protein